MLLLMTLKILTAIFKDSEWWSYTCNDSPRQRRCQRLCHWRLCHWRLCHRLICHRQTCSSHSKLKFWCWYNNHRFRLMSSRVSRLSAPSRASRTAKAIYGTKNNSRTIVLFWLVSVLVARWRIAVQLSDIQAETCSTAARQRRRAAVLANRIQRLLPIETALSTEIAISNSADSKARATSGDINSVRDGPRDVILSRLSEDKQQRINTDIKIDNSIIKSPNFATIAASSDLTISRVVETFRFLEHQFICLFYTSSPSSSAALHQRHLALNKMPLAFLSKSAKRRRLSDLDDANSRETPTGSQCSAFSIWQNNGELIF